LDLADDQAERSQAPDVLPISDAQSDSAMMGVVQNWLLCASVLVVAVASHFQTLICAFLFMDPQCSRVVLPANQGARLPEVEGIVCFVALVLARDCSGAQRCA
jgi:hypothetical protein